MKVIKSFAAAAFTAAVIGAFGVANAAPVDLTNITGGWSNVVPTEASSPYISTSGNGTDTATVSWGNPASNAGQSSYVFEASSDINVNVPPDSLVTLGTFTHNNNPVYAPSITAATLTVSLDLAIDSIAQGAYDFVFDFTHNETPNSGPGNCCNDEVSVADSSLSQDFLLDGVLYTISIVGFRLGDGTIVDVFSTIEGQANTAELVGMITASVAEVPIPGALVLMLSGLAGLGFSSRKQKAA